jgi:hypothetical protein
MDKTCNWRMTVNGRIVLEAKGSASLDAQTTFISDNSGIPGEETEVTFTGIGEATESYDDIFILDYDARFGSLLYVKSHIDASYGPPLQQEPGNWRLPFKQKDITRSIVFVHQEIKYTLYEESFSVADGPDFRNLFAGESHLHGANEGIEGYQVTECLTYGGGGSSGLTYRVPGSLCVSSQGHAAIYANNRSGWQAEYNEELIDINRVVLSETGLIHDPVTILENALEADFSSSGLRIAPIRTTN